MMDPPFEHEPSVRFADIDGLGHVNNAIFLTYLEEARVALFQELLGAEGLALFPFLLAHAEIDFERPIVMEDKLRVKLWVAELGTASFRLGYEIYAGEERVGQAETVQVWIDQDTKTSRPIPEEIRDALGALTRSNG